MQTHPKLPGAAILLLIAASVPALAESRIEKELALAPGGRLSLDTDSGSVTVRGGSRTGVHLVITSAKDDIESLYRLDFKETPGLVEITARRKGEEKQGLLSWFSWGRSGLDYEIEVPEKTALAIDTAGGSITISGIEGETRLDTSGGSIRVGDVQGAVFADTSGGSISIESVTGDIRADTSGGSISLEAIQGAARVDTSGGSIRVQGVTGDLVAETSGGSISVSEAGGEVEASTSGGSVSVALLPGNSRGGDLSSSGGGVRVTLDPGANLEIDATASGGSVTCEPTLADTDAKSRSELRGRLGAGGERLKLRASGGSVKIESL